MTAAAGAGVGVGMFFVMIPILAVLATLGAVATMYAGLHKLTHVTYAYYLRQAQEQLEALLADVDANLRRRCSAACPPRGRRRSARTERACPSGHVRKFVVDARGPRAVDTRRSARPPARRAENPRAVRQGRCFRRLREG
ncbi:hypothetical protein OV079_53180 [Nannocystis pusilla]|uniref:Uncharacterized protein n=1 Tax=Nannocystis pusilla TaxID=889268 RepID=A0A9X3J4R3_9BACT|nr:hypothetical protein [Nannocystis pusilla]MCY1014129.1 hypothetical protein [Nannocystis pusilla]